MINRVFPPEWWMDAQSYSGLSKELKNDIAKMINEFNTNALEAQETLRKDILDKISPSPESK